MDFKGHFATVGEGRCHPLTVLDDHSRFNVVLQACAFETTATVQAHLERAFATYGLPRQINTDNGAPWGASRQFGQMIGFIAR
ncbi:Mobile element protein [Caballeronia sordidicola]|uniref:Mobile element protein n=1 Tax=Caballeronia sordidicola TaxID=196367 RepID=A0A242MDD7_CABSO|nr:Mobile element protein [Caballeronia sordidicola]